MKRKTVTDYAREVVAEIRDLEREIPAAGPAEEDATRVLLIRRAMRRAVEADRRTRSR